jgi:hypothetical protein
MTKVWQTLIQQGSRVGPPKPKIPKKGWGPGAQGPPNRSLHCNQAMRTEKGLRDYNPQNSTKTRVHHSPSATDAWWFPIRLACSNKKRPYISRVLDVVWPDPNLVALER